MKAKDTKDSALDVRDFSQTTPPAADSLTLTTAPQEDYGALVSHVPTPGRKYAVAGSGVFSTVFDTMPLKQLTGEKREALEKITKTTLKEDARNVRYSINEKGEVYNALPANEIAFVFAIEKALSDSTPDVNKRIEADRKTGKTGKKGKKGDEGAQKKEKTAVLGAIEISLEAYGRLQYEEDKETYIQNEKYKDAEVTKEERLLYSLGFHPGEAVVIIEKNSFIQDYLGLQPNSAKRKALTETIENLQTAKIALIKSGVKKESEFWGVTQNLIGRVVTFKYLKKGQETKFYAIAMPNYTRRIFTPSYLTFPANQGEILGAIMQFSQTADGMLRLYYKLLNEASHNFGSIKGRRDVQILTFKEAELLRLVATEEEIKKYKARAYSKLYGAGAGTKGLKLFYEKGLLVEPVKQPTEEERKRAKTAGRDVEITVKFKRLADEGKKKAR